MESIDKIVETLRRVSKPLKSVEIAALSGITKDEAGNCIKLLQKQGKIYSPRRCFYTLKTKK